MDKISKQQFMDYAHYKELLDGAADEASNIIEVVWARKIYNAKMKKSKMKADKYYYPTYLQVVNNYKIKLEEDGIDFNSLTEEQQNGLLSIVEDVWENLKEIECS